MDDCRDATGRVWATCNACRDRYRTHPNRQGRPAEDEPDEPIENIYGEPPDGVEVLPPDEFDQALIDEDDSDFMNIDIPGDKALNQTEQQLLDTFRAKLDSLALEVCEACHERDFNMDIREGFCSRCRRDTAGPVKKMSAENKVMPGEPVKLLS